MSLKDALASLLDPAPAPEVDPDAIELEDTPNGLAEPLELHADRKPSRIAAERPRLRADIQLEGEAYRGRRSSRAAVFGDESDDAGGIMANGSGSGSDEDDDDDDDDDDADALLAGSDEGSSGDDGDAADGALELGDGLAAPLLRGVNEGPAAALGDSEGDEQPQEQPGDEDHLSDEDGAIAAARAAMRGSSEAMAQRHSRELAALEAEYGQAEAQDAAALAALRQHNEKERAKSHAVRRQRGLWERSLELRILLQRALAGSNRLPQPQVYTTLLPQHEQLRAAFGQLQQSAAQTLQTLLELQAALHANNPAILAASGQQAQQPQAGGKRSRPSFEGEAQPPGSTELWRVVEQQQAAFAPFRDESLDKWHRRTVLSSGSAALRNNLRALNQSVSSQVAAVMKDPTRFIQRSQLERSATTRPLCHGHQAEQQQQQQQQQDASPTDQAAAAAAAGAGASPAAAEAERDPETYDDGEFYQQLLKEFLEAGSGAPRGVAMARAEKRRKKVDRRASKGRKVRYHVHDKLVNFMTAQAAEQPAFAEQLFSNLFGYSSSSAA